jgi:sortase (surface protein transpeptidase)
MSDRPSQTVYRRRSVNQRAGYRYSRRASLDGFERSKQTEASLGVDLVDIPTVTKMAKKPRTTIIHDVKPAVPRQNKSMVLKRQAVTKAPVVKKKKPLKRSFHINHHNKQWASVAGVLLLVIFVGIGYEAKYKSVAKNEVNATSTRAVSAVEHGVDESEISQALYGEHVVKPEEPRYLRVPRLSIDARIYGSSTLARKDMKPPLNVYDVNWFEGSSMPGNPGAMMLGGYVMGPTKSGVFYRLGALKEGDQLEVEAGSGKRFVYRVVKLETYESEGIDMETFKSPAVGDKPGLNLVTFTDQYNEQSGQYKKRLIVFTVLDSVQ